MRPPSRGRAKPNQGADSFGRGSERRSKSRQDQDFSWNPNNQQRPGSSNRVEKGASVGRGADRGGSMGRGSDVGGSRGRGRSDCDKNGAVGQRRNRGENSLSDLGKSDTLSYVSDSLNSLSISSRNEGVYNGLRPEEIPCNGGGASMSYNKGQYQELENDLPQKKSAWSLPAEQWPSLREPPPQYTLARQEPQQPQRQEPQQWNVRREEPQNPPRHLQREEPHNPSRHLQREEPQNPPRQVQEPQQWNVPERKSPPWSEGGLSVLRGVNSVQSVWKNDQNPLDNAWKEDTSAEAGWKEAKLGVKLPRGNSNDNASNTRGLSRNSCSTSTSLDVISSGQ